MAAPAQTEPQGMFASVSSLATTLTGCTTPSHIFPIHHNQVIASIFEPGTNAGLVQAMSYSFYALFVTLAAMLVLTGGSIHFWALLVLSVGLFLSIKWYDFYVSEIIRSIAD
jgi:predicted lysophospholipase L1 biosynthesis ABC-type transport system permease subunit